MSAHRCLGMNPRTFRPAQHVAIQTRIGRGFVIPERGRIEFRVPERSGRPFARIRYPM